MQGKRKTIGYIAAIIALLICSAAGWHEAMEWIVWATFSYMGGNSIEHIAQQAFARAASRAGLPAEENPDA